MKEAKQKPSIKTLAGQEIISIIEACSKFNVTSFKYGDLEIQVGTSAKLDTPPGTEIPDTSQMEEDSLREGERRLREDQLDELRLTNPMFYEELISKEGVSDVDDKPGDE